MKTWVWMAGLLITVAMVSAYYTNPYLGGAPEKEERSLGTRGGFTHVLAKREGLGQQVDQRVARKSVQGFTPYARNQLPSIRKALGRKQFFVVRNTYNQYRSATSYADETLKQKLTKVLGIRVVYDPSAGKNVLIDKMPMRKLVELLNDPRSRVETFRDSDVDVDAVLAGLGLGKGVFIPRMQDDNIKY